MRAFVLSLLSLLLFVLPLAAQEGYLLPPPEVVALVDAPPTPSVSLSPDHSRMLLIERDSLPRIEDLSRRMLRLAGMRIDPVANGRYSNGFNRGLILRGLRSENEVRIPLPRDARIGFTRWSHNSRHFVYTLVTERGTELWAVSVDNPQQPRRLTDRLNTVTTGVSWMPDGNSVLCGLVPENRGSEPPASSVPQGPNIQETSGNTSPVRTYQDLLSNPYDADLFEHYATAELVVLGADRPGQRTAGEPAVYSGASVSPDGLYLLATRINRPYSYLQPYRSFPRTTFVRNLSTGADVVLTDLPLDENIPLGGVRTGPRNISWRPGRHAALVWVEALDGGDPKKEVAHRDRWMALRAPFAGQRAQSLLQLEHRAQGLTFLPDPTRVITREYDRDRRWTRSLLHDFGSPGSEPIVLEDRSSQDRYGDPGRIVMRPDETGRALVRVDGDWIYRTGSGASQQGALPFLDRQNLQTLQTERLWRCAPGAYESVVTVMEHLHQGTPLFITRRETPVDPPNYFIRDLVAEGQVVLTAFTDPTPQIRGVHKELVTYEREDGVPLSATLYLPPNYEPGTKLPLVVWAYPREFSSARTAGQISSSPWRFTRIGGTSHLHLLTQGYAIMDGATMPVIGDPETMNDTFVEQIVAAARAAIDKAAEMGVADRTRVVAAGHSYGAFMTANLLAHCDLFQAGIARSGAYNRTLTPFGFQSERRTLWESPETYFAISPFMHANKINEPLLMIHGEADNNSGTFPIQSRRLFQAIKGNGGTARLVMLPNESHGYRARESVLHTMAEMINWCDEHLKGPRILETGFREEGRR